MIAIIDYGMGNIHSVQKALESMGAKTIVTNKPDGIKASDKAVLPGVGAFDDAMQELKRQNLILALTEHIKSKKIFLGICLGGVPHLNAQTGFLESNPVGPSSGFFETGRSLETNVSSCPDEIDPLEPFNRGIFWINSGIDFILIEPLAMLYTEVFPEYVRERVGYVLRNLGEPVVFVNNILQGELEDARVTLGRFFFNSTFGLVGIFDVSTDWGLPYKKTEKLLTFYVQKRCLKFVNWFIKNQ